MNHKIAIIGIGERSSLVNNRINFELNSEDQERVQIFTIDYSRDEKNDFDQVDKNKGFILDSTLGLLLYNKSKFKELKFSDKTISPLPQELRAPIEKQIDSILDQLSKYWASVDNKIPRIIVHACLNQDHPEGIKEAIKEYYNLKSYPKKKETERLDFSRVIFFEVLKILEVSAKRRKMKIDIYPVILLRTSFLNKDIIINKEKLIEFIEYLGPQIEKNQFFKIGYIIQDTNSRGNSINVYEHISLLYLHILVLAYISQSVKKLDLWENTNLRKLIYEINPEPGKEKQRWLSLGFIDGVLHFKTFKTKFSKFLVKESLEYILKEEEEAYSMLKDPDKVAYSSITPQIQLEENLLSILTPNEKREKATPDYILKLFQEKVQHDKAYYVLAKNHNIMDIPSGKGDNRTFKEYLDKLEKLNYQNKTYRECPEIWEGYIQESKPYIQRIRDMAKDFLQPTKMREIDFRVRSITNQIIHDFRLFCSIISCGEMYKPDGKEFYNSNIEKEITNFFHSTKSHFTWKYLRESLQKAFRIFQYDVYNPSLSKVNQSVQKVEELRNYDLTSVQEAVQSNRYEVESLPPIKSIFFFTTVFILGAILTSTAFFSPHFYLQYPTFLSILTKKLPSLFLSSSGISIFGKPVFLYDILTTGFLIIIGVLFSSYLILHVRNIFIQYKQNIEGKAKEYKINVQNLFREMFGININLKLSGFLMEYINEIEKSFVKLNDFETKSRNYIRELEQDLSDIYGLESREYGDLTDSNLNSASFLGIQIHPKQEKNSIIISLLSIDIQDDITTIRGNIRYQFNDINLIKKYLFRFDRPIEENFIEFSNSLERGIPFECIESLVKNWKFSTVPPNIQPYIPLKVYTTDFNLNIYPERDFKELTLKELMDHDSNTDHHILTIFYPPRKFTYDEIKDELISEIKQGYG